MWEPIQLFQNPVSLEQAYKKETSLTRTLVLKAHEKDDGGGGVVYN